MQQSYSIVHATRIASMVLAILLGIFAMLALHGCSSQQRLTPPQLTIGADSAGCAVTVEGYGSRIRTPLPPVVCTAIPGVLVIQLLPPPPDGQATTGD